MGGRTKYIVNGHNAQQHTVQNLFQSVQLNINNPHFLIMQGRITKVLNMKSTEILSMVEEAAGTKMFEDRKNKAFTTMAKKERKVDEIRKVQEERIDTMGSSCLNANIDLTGGDHTTIGSVETREARVFGFPKDWIRHWTLESYTNCLWIYPTSGQ